MPNEIIIIVSLCPNSACSHSLLFFSYGDLWSLSYKAKPWRQNTHSDNSHGLSDIPNECGRNELMRRGALGEAAPPSGSFWNEKVVSCQFPWRRPPSCLWRAASLPCCSVPGQKVKRSLAMI